MRKLYAWHSDTIIADLLKIKGVIDVSNNGQGGSYDTDNLIISIDSSNDCLWVCGFDDESDGIDEPDEVDVPFIEITDGLSSAGGLNSKNWEVAEVYILVRQYFVDKGFMVVNSMKAYF